MAPLLPSCPSNSPWSPDPPGTRLAAEPPKREEEPKNSLDWKKLETEWQLSHPVVMPAPPFLEFEFGDGDIGKHQGGVMKGSHFCGFFPKDGTSKTESLPLVWDLETGWVRDHPGAQTRPARSCCLLCSQDKELGVCLFASGLPWCLFA